MTVLKAGRGIWANTLLCSCIKPIRHPPSATRSANKRRRLSPIVPVGAGSNRRSTVTVWHVPSSTVTL